MKHLHCSMKNRYKTRKGTQKEYYDASFKIFLIEEMKNLVKKNPGF